MKVRIISAIVAIAIAAVVLLLSKTIVFTVAISLIASLIVYELLKATDCLKDKIVASISLLFTFLHPFIFLYAEKYKSIFYMIFVLLAFLAFIKDHSKIKYEKYFISLAFPILVSFSMSTLLLLNRDYKLIYVIVALCSAWIADTGAYFTGTLIGKHKLSPQISPKKSVEGFFGGIIIDAIVLEVIYIFAMNTDSTMFHNIVFFIVALVCGAVGTLGDLSASVIKRQTGIKDFGNIMPGHGGALDRFDSVLMVAPLFYVCVNVFNL